jgi:hypothetical protein
MILMLVTLANKFSELRTAANPEALDRYGTASRKAGSRATPRRGRLSTRCLVSDLNRGSYPSNSFRAYRVVATVEVGTF